MALTKFYTVEEEIKKNQELDKADLDLLRDWHKKQPHLPPISDFELILFLHSNYHRTEPSKIMIDTFFTLRTHVPEFFSNCDPLGSTELREIMKVTYCLVLPSTTPEGYKVIFVKLQDFEPSHFVLADSIKLVSMVIELSLYTEGTSPGYIMVIDMEGAVFGHLACLSPMTMKKLVYFMQDALPVRLKGIHYVNTVPFVDLVLNIARPFMKKELMDMLVFHSGPNIPSEMIPTDILPKELGGKAGTLKDLWSAQVKEIEDHHEWFKKGESRQVNEAARPGKAKNATDLFGVEGSFKKLDID